MRLMTVWNAYGMATVLFDLSISAGESCIRSGDVDGASAMVAISKTKLRQIETFKKHIIERIKECDDLHDWAIREIDAYEEEIRHANLERAEIYDRRAGI